VICPQRVFLKVFLVPLKMPRPRVLFLSVSFQLFGVSLVMLEGQEHYFRSMLSPSKKAALKIRATTKYELSLIIALFSNPIIVHHWTHSNIL
jgi:hypothetical protein